MRVPIITALLLVALSVLTDIYIFRDIRQYCLERMRKLWLWLYGISSLVCWGFIIAFLIIPKRSPDQSILPAMWILYSYITVYVGKFTYCIFSLLGRLVKRLSKSSKNRGVIVGSTLSVILFAVLWYGVLFTRYDIDVRKVDLTSDRLPKSFDGLKVLQFSDIHVGTWGTDTTFISALVDSINAQNADIVLFTGDIVNRQSSELIPFKSVLSRIKAKRGVYAILGNHDYSSYVTWPSKEDGVNDFNNLCKTIREMNWSLLRDGTSFLVENQDSIAIIGVENWGKPPFDKLGNLEKAYNNGSGSKSLNDDLYKILMTHNPDHWNLIVKNISNVNLTLAGHTHAMQCVFKVGNWRWSPSVFKYKMWGGLHTEKAKDQTPMNLYVNIGAGEVGFPARVADAKPELTLFTLHSQ